MSEAVTCKKCGEPMEQHGGVNIGNGLVTAKYWECRQCNLWLIPSPMAMPWSNLYEWSDHDTGALND